MKYMYQTLALVWLGFAAAGCSLSQPYPAKDTFVLRGGDIPRAPYTIAESVRVEPVRIAPPYDSRNLVSRTGSVAVQRDYYNVFVAPPADLATAELIRMLSESGVFAQVSGASSAESANVSLECMVTELCADQTDPSSPVGICRTTFRRLKQQPGSTSVIDDRTFTASIPIASNSGAGVASALGRAFGATVRAYVEAVGSLQPSQPLRTDAQVRTDAPAKSAR